MINLIINDDLEEIAELDGVKSMANKGDHTYQCDCGSKDIVISTSGTTDSIVQWSLVCNKCGESAFIKAPSVEPQ